MKRITDSRGIVALAVALTVAAPACLAQPADQSTAESLEYEDPAVPELPNLGSMLGRVVISTSMVLAAAVVTIFVARKCLRLAPATTQSGRSATCTDTVHLGRHCTVNVLRVAGHTVLVGCDPSGIKAMLHLPDSFGTTMGDLGAADRDENRAEALLV